jgi:hypothetical protein
MSHQRVQLPPERTLISTRNQVPEGVRAFHEGINVSLCAERYTLEVSVPWVLPRASRTVPFLTVTPFSAPEERALEVEYSPKSMYDPLAAPASPVAYKSRQASATAATTTRKVFGGEIPLTKFILQSRSLQRTF